MIPAGLGLDSASGARLLVDTNLLVLFAIGTVKLNRIEIFKRTRKYIKSDYNLLVRVLANSIPCIQSPTSWQKSVILPS